MSEADSYFYNNYFNNQCQEIHWRSKCYTCQQFLDHNDLATIDIPHGIYHDESRTVYSIPLCEQCVTKTLNKFGKKLRQKEIVRELDLI